MEIELNKAHLLELTRKVGVERAIALVREMMAERIIRHYNIKSIKQLDIKNKVQFLMTKEHRKIVIEYMSRQ